MLKLEDLLFGAGFQIDSDGSHLSVELLRIFRPYPR